MADRAARRWPVEAAAAVIGVPRSRRRRGGADDEAGLRRFDCRAGLSCRCPRVLMWGIRLPVRYWRWSCGTEHPPYDPTTSSPVFGRVAGLVVPVPPLQTRIEQGLLDPMTGSVMDPLDHGSRRVLTGATADGSGVHREMPPQGDAAAADRGGRPARWRTARAAPTKLAPGPVRDRRPRRPTRLRAALSRPEALRSMYAHRRDHPVEPPNPPGRAPAARPPPVRRHPRAAPRAARRPTRADRPSRSQRPPRARRPPCGAGTGRRRPPRTATSETSSTAACRRPKKSSRRRSSQEGGRDGAASVDAPRLAEPPARRRPPRRALPNEPHARDQALRPRLPATLTAAGLATAEPVADGRASRAPEPQGASGRPVRRDRVDAGRRASQSSRTPALADGADRRCRAVRHLPGLRRLPTRGWHRREPSDAATRQLTDRSTDGSRRHRSDARAVHRTKRRSRLREAGAGCSTSAVGPSARCEGWPNRRKSTEASADGATGAEGGAAERRAKASRHRAGDSSRAGSQQPQQPGESKDSAEGEGTSSSSRRRRRRRRSSDSSERSRVVGRHRRRRWSRSASRARPPTSITSVEGSTRIEAKKQRRREGREAGRRRAPILSESEFLARRESVDRVMVIRQRDDVTQIAVLEDERARRALRRPRRARAR